MSSFIKPELHSQVNNHLIIEDKSYPLPRRVYYCNFSIKIKKAAPGIMRRLGDYACGLDSLFNETFNFSCMAI